MNTSLGKLISNETIDSTEIMPFADLKILPEITICANEPTTDEVMNWLGSAGYYEYVTSALIGKSKL